MTIYISTGSIKNKTIQQSIDYLSENGIKNIELSEANMIQIFFKN